MDPQETLLEDVNIFQNCISALSDVQEDDQDIYFKSFPKHVRILDGISLLFVYEGSSEVCATTFIQQTGSATILWARNSQQVPGEVEQKYMNGLCNLFVGQADTHEILKHVVKQCWKKVISRIVKTATIIPRPTKGQENILGIEETTGRLERLQEKLRRANAIDSETPDVEGLDRFIYALADANEASDFVIICQILQFAQLLTIKNAPDPKQVPPLFDYVQYRGIFKLAVYYRTNLDLRSVCKRLKIKSLTLQQVTTPPQYQVDVYRRTRDAMNAFHPYLPEDIQPFTDHSRLAFDYDRPPPVGDPLHTRPIVASQHCELTVALYMLQNHLDKGIRVPLG